MNKVKPQARCNGSTSGCNALFLVNGVPVMVRLKEENEPEKPKHGRKHK